MAPSEKRHLFDNPANVKRIIRLLFACCTVLLLLDLIVHRHLGFHGGVFATESWFGYYSVYGFVACVLLVLAAQQMRKVLMRGEDYYDR